MLENVENTCQITKTSWQMALSHLFFRWFFQNVNDVHNKVKPGHSHRFGKQSSQPYDCPSFCNPAGTRRRCGSFARGTCDRRNGGRRGSRRLDLRWKGDLWQCIDFFCRKRWFALAWFCNMGSWNIYNECCLGLYEAMLSICLQFVLKHLHGQGMTPNQPDWGTRKSSEVLPSPSKTILVGPTCKEFSTSWNKNSSSIWSNLSFKYIYIYCIGKDYTNCNGSLVKFLFL